MVMPCGLFNVAAGADPLISEIMDVVVPVGVIFPIAPPNEPPYPAA